MYKDFIIAGKLHPATRTIGNVIQNEYADHVRLHVNEPELKHIHRISFIKDMIVFYQSIAIDSASWLLLDPTIDISYKNQDLDVYSQVLIAWTEWIDSELYDYARVARLKEKQDLLNMSKASYFDAYKYLVKYEKHICI